MPSQRRYFRVPARLEARLVLRGESPVAASLSDLSLDGASVVVREGATPDAALAVRRWLQVGGLVHLQVTLGGRPVVLPGRVAWLKSVQGSREMLAGMHFEEVDDPTKRIVRGWLVRGIAAIQGAARHVLLERWDDAAECLAAVGIDDAEPPTISAVLEYAARGHAAATA